MSKKKSFLLRLDPETWREIESWAADELRSVNGQIEFILRRAAAERRGRARSAKIEQKDGKEHSK